MVWTDQQNLLNSSSFVHLSTEASYPQPEMSISTTGTRYDFSRPLLRARYRVLPLQSKQGVSEAALQ